MSEGLIHEVLPVGWLQCNCSILGDPESREAIVVDPGDEVERILDVIALFDLKVRAIVNTHAHIDHVGGLVKLNQATKAPVMMHREDLALYRILDQQAAAIGVAVPAMGYVDAFLREGDTVHWGAYQARVIHTPGHTPGSVCLHLPGAAHGSGREMKQPIAEPGRLLAGDTLFAGSIGRTDLWGGSFEKIIHSIQTKLMELPEDTLVFPGHGPGTTIGDEREMNPFLRRA